MPRFTNKAYFDTITSKEVTCLPMLIMGQLTPDWFERCGSSIDRAAEISTFLPSCLVYYYFDDKELEPGVTVLDAITNSHTIGSSARCWTPTAILQSIGTDEPHYGDGIYVTFHEALNAAHLDVRRHHGLSVSRRRCRVLLRVHAPRRFQRIEQTGGVGLAAPLTPPKPAQMLFVGPPEVEVIRIERFEHTTWTPA